MKVGITLLYSVLEEGNIIGALKSYVVECADKYSLIAKAQIKAEQQINSSYSNHKFLGLEDVFIVTGETKEGELLGRSTLYDIDSINDSIKLVKFYEDSVVETESDSNTFICSLVYFYEGDEDEKGYTFIINTIVKGSGEKIANKLNRLAISNQMLDKIIETSVELMYSDKIQFLGVEDINLITEDLETGGSFLTLYNEEVQDEQELLSMLPSHDELLDIINDVYNI